MIAGFSAHEYIFLGNFRLPYRLFVPKNLTNDKIPLILYFHGAGTWGDDNKAQVVQASRVARAVNKIQPCVVVAPQTKENARWVDLDWGLVNHTQPEKASTQLEASFQLIKEISENYPIDLKRIYVTGNSMGGYATWDIICRYPDFFAAAFPVCGGGDVRQMEKIKELPIWTFHGALDGVVPVENSRNLVTKLQTLNNKIKYIEYADVLHDAWTNAYREPELYNWLLNQQNNH